jgi:hypothetical protein
MNSATVHQWKTRGGQKLTTEISGTNDTETGGESTNQELTRTPRKPMRLREGRINESTADMEPKEANEKRQRINTLHGNKDSQLDEDKMMNNESRAGTKTKVANEMKD